MARDVNALAVTHVGEHSHTTVIGHSYGWTTVADAAAGYGMSTDDVILVNVDRCQGSAQVRIARGRPSTTPIRRPDGGSDISQCTVWTPAIAPKDLHGKCTSNMLWFNIIDSTSE
jgi:hypothetical protein